MLFRISPLIGPDLLFTLASMGHGDTIALVDSNFPGAAFTTRLHRIPGVALAPVLDAVLSLLPLDGFIPNPAVTMQVVGDPEAIPDAVRDIVAVCDAHGAQPPDTLERFAFYEAAKACFAIVQTGERRSYGNVILTKGIVPADQRFE